MTRIARLKPYRTESLGKPKNKKKEKIWISLNILASDTYVCRTLGRQL
jgi:hypothetical protein